MNMKVGRNILLEHYTPNKFRGQHEVQNYLVGVANICRNMAKIFPHLPAVSPAICCEVEKIRLQINSDI